MKKQQPFAHEIVPGLYLGNYMAARIIKDSDPEQQQEWCVVTAMSKKDALIALPGPCRFYKHMLVPVDDVPDAPIHKHFDRVSRFIDDALKNDKTVLVHCAAGVSRSATLVCSYMMDLFGFGSDAAIEFVRSRRPIVHPNGGFRVRLQGKENRMA